MKPALFLVMAAAAVLGCGSSNAAPPSAAASISEAPLDCAISQGKVIVITNSTNGDIAAGTPMGFDAVRRGGHSHYGKTFAGPALPHGHSFSLGGEDSISCTAWYRRPLVMSP